VNVKLLRPILATVCLWSLAAQVVAAGELGPATPMTGLFGAEFRDLHSDIVEETYRVFVSAPMAVDPDASYPVIYVLDGNGMFGAAQEIARLLAMGGEIPHAYVVGIGYAVDNGFAGVLGKRYRDYTPTKGGEVEASALKQFDATGNIAPGGGPEFLRVLREEIKPGIEAAYPVDPADATIAGASLGGLFPSWVLLTQPETFQRYVIISPSIWWHQEEVWQWEERAASERSDIEARVFITAGGLELVEMIQAQIRASAEGDGPFNDAIRESAEAYDRYGWPRMAEITPEFADKLNSRGYPGLSAVCHNMPGETHMSVPAGAYSRGLRYVFGAWSPDD
jgi:predicted alpha/beta superfamily hydrolase